MELATQTTHEFKTYICSFVYLSYMSYKEVVLSWFGPRVALFYKKKEKKKRT